MISKFLWKSENADKKRKTVDNPSNNKKNVLAKSTHELTKGHGLAWDIGFDKNNFGWFIVCSWLIDKNDAVF